MNTQRLFIYTENYAYGGVERFLADLIQSVPPEREAFLLYHPYPGFEERLRAAVTRPVRLVPVPALSAPRLREALGSALPGLAAAAAARAISFLASGALRTAARRRAASVLRGLGARPGDVLHAVNGGYPGAPTCGAAAQAGHALGLRVIYTVLSVHEPRFAGRVDAGAEAALLASADVIACNCEAGLAALERHRGFPRSKLVCVWNGVAPAGAPGSRGAMLRRSWLGDGNLLLGCLGALYPLKGHDVALDALPAVLARRPGARLVLVGEGVSRAALEARARGLGVEKSVVFAGYLPGDAGDALEAFDALVHPSTQTEGLPYAVLEAMARGKPVVASRLGGIPEAVEDGVTGLLVEPGDAPALAAALDVLLADARSRSAFGEAGRRRQRERFSLDAMAARLAALHGFA